MSNPLYAFPVVCEQTLRALARYPERTAFSWSGGSITYRGATDLIGRIQTIFMRLGLKPGSRADIAILDKQVLPTPDVILDLRRLAPQCQFLTWPELSGTDSPRCGSFGSCCGPTAVGIRASS